MNSDKNSYFHRLMLFLLASLLVHTGLYFGLGHLFDKQHFYNNARPIEITLYDQRPEEQSFVTDPDVGEVLDKLKKHSAYLSKFTRRVKKEMVARESGKTKNRTPKAPNEMESEIKKKKNKDILKSITGLSMKDLSKNQKKRLNTNFLPSTIAEHIPNVAEGSFTSLNTDQFSYYAFFNRINEQIRLRWTSNLRNLSMNLPAEIVNQYAKFPRQTHVEMVLDKEGNFQSIFVDKTSGAKLLDQAAKEAFADAAPYLNPPSGLIGEDGFIRLNYSLRVVWRPRYIARDKGMGN